MTQMKDVDKNSGTRMIDMVTFLYSQENNHVICINKV